MSDFEEQIAEVQKLDEMFGSRSRPMHYYIGALLKELRTLWQKRLYILGVMAVAVVAGVVLALVLPVRYTANAYLMPPASSNAISQLSLMMGMRGGGDPGGGVGGQIGSALGMRSPGQLYMRVLRSNTVEDRLIDRFNLMSRYRTTQHRATRQRLESNTILSEETKSGVLCLAVTDKDPAIASQMANAYIEELNRALLEMSTNAAEKERQFYEAQLATARQRMQGAAQEFSKFTGHNDAIDVPEQGKATVETMAAVQGQLIAAQAELNGLLQTYNEGQPPVQVARARISELQRQMEKLGGKQGTTGDVLPNMKELSSLGVPYLHLYQELRIQQAVVEALSQQYEIAKLEEARQLPRVQVLDPAQIPERKSFPPRTVIVLVFAFLGCCLGSIKVIVQTWWASASPQNPWKKLLS